VANKFSLSSVFHKPSSNSHIARRVSGVAKLILFTEIIRVPARRSSAKDVECSSLGFNQGCGAEAILDDWSRNFKLWSWSQEFGFQCHSPSLRGKSVVQITQWFSVFNGPNSLSQKLLDVEPEPQTSDDWTWSLKFKYRLHSPGFNTKVLKCAVTHVTTTRLFAQWNLILTHLQHSEFSI